MMTSRSELVDAALYYADIGYRVFPCHPNTKEPMTARGFYDASSDPTQIEAWWAAEPMANIGIPTEGLILVDVDGEGNPWPGSPERAMSLSGCPVSLTPHGGLHRLYKQPTDKVWKNTVSLLAPMVDTRVAGGYFIAPPSLLDGVAYRWAETCELDCSPGTLPCPPPWLVMALDAIEAGRNGNGTSLAHVGNIIPDGQRNDTLARLAGAMRRTGMGYEEILPALLKVNALRCSPPISSREVQRIVKSICRYEPDQITVAVIENHWAQDAAALEVTAGPEDPGALPEGLLRVPGFISEVMDYTLATAPYPNVAMSFSGALALQAMLAGRKVRDSGDNRTNLYILALAHSSAGKDRPRKVNNEILHAIGLSNQIGGLFASGEGIQDVLFQTPSILFQTDEIDGILQSINKSKDARHESIMNTLLTMYSSANSLFPMRRKAGQEDAGVIDQPCLCVLGTAIPNHYYDALSTRMLTNGFFARMLVFECAKRAPGQEPRLLSIPSRVLETAGWWASYSPTSGNMQGQHPRPAVVPCSDAAAAILVESRLEAESEYAKAEDQADTVGTTVWGRVSEHIRKLALVYAISENHLAPVVEAEAVGWARALVMHQTRRMLFQCAGHVADNPFHALCLRAIEKIREVPSGEISHSRLLKKMQMEAREFMALMTTLEQQGEVVVRTQSHEGSGRPGRFYALRQGARP